jgi:ABC-type siderophore export system fused ATPase/permease subunit
MVSVLTINASVQLGLLIVKCLLYYTYLSQPGLDILVISITIFAFEIQILETKLH